MEVYFRVIGALVLGAAMRTLLPYLVAGFTGWQEGGAWPKFEMKYLGSLGLALIGYAVAVLTEGIFLHLAEMTFVNIVALAYSGQELARGLLKVFVPRQR